MTRTKSLITALLIAVLSMVPALAIGSSIVSAQPSVQGSLCDGADNLQWNGPNQGDCTIDGETTSTVNDTITLVVNIFSWIVGVVAVIMIIWGGFKYITSGGDSNNVTAAKNTILYAIIGLVIVALAQVIVRFVLGSATGVTN